jgi:ABC-type glycerol-3-phosphate transport system substrate-binding protein
VPRHRLLIPLSILVLALGLAACGGGGESDEDKIADAIETAATSTDPAVCGETQTLAFMEQSSSSSGKEAEKECEKEAKAGEGQPDSVSVTEINVDGETATANAAFKGGIFDAQTLELALVEEDGDWKLDKLTGFAKFDPESLVNSFAEQIEKEPELEPEMASCLIEGIEELSNSELESVIVENNTEAFGEIAKGCE